MFLVTTADERTWNKDKKIIFLGEWCKLYSRKHIWEKLDFETLPYHWDNRDKFFRDRKYLSIVYERYLENISNTLNIIHNCYYPIRYWRILIGVWLLHFIEIIFDRYVCLKKVVESCSVKSTWIIHSDDSRWIPQDMHQFHQFYISDFWNHHIFGEIIKHLNLLSYKHINIEYAKYTDDRREFPLNNFKKSIKPFIASILNKTGNFSNKIYFSSSMFGKKHQAYLELCLGQIPQLIEANVSLPHFSTSETRFLYNYSIAKNEFEELLEFIIPKQIPAAYLEGYKCLRQKALRLYPNNVKTIFTANSYHFNEGFKVWSAEKVNQGTKLLIGQHGGNMGSSSISSTEDYQIDISDQYFSWGWVTADQGKVIPLPAIQLLRFKKNLTPDKRGGILHILSSLPRYSYIMYSVPLASQFLDYLNDQIVFLNNLSEPVINLLKVRLDSTRSYGWFVRERLKDNGFENILDNENKDILKTLKRFRLCIATANTTSFLETFSADFPTLLFWCSNHWELRPEAKPLYDMLYNCGILHYTPDSAVKKLYEIYDDPIAWWGQEFIQKAKNEFCAQFAVTSDDWLKKWKMAVKSL